MSKIKKIIKKTPIIPYLYRSFRDYRLKKKQTEEVFLDIYKNNKWGGKDSISGRGSDIHQTKSIAKELPTVFNNFNISTMLDIPCGDFHWMKDVDLSNVNYIGSDIVSELVEKNSTQYKRDGLSFQKLNLIKDKLPKVDLIFCRDCLVHLSFEDIFNALRNICDSHSEYLLTTTFSKRSHNKDIATGNWRTLNLESTPFTLPKPLKIINEGCTEGDGSYADKALGLWKIADIQKTLLEYQASS
jgi:hypothetical protein